MQPQPLASHARSLSSLDVDTEATQTPGLEELEFKDLEAQSTLTLHVQELSSSTATNDDDNEDCKDDPLGSSLADLVTAVGGTSHGNSLEKDNLDASCRVDFDTNDPQDPRNFSTSRKWQILMVTMSLEMWTNTISSIYAFGSPQVAHEFNVGDVVSKLPGAVYLFGFALGPILAAPLSEDYGRYPVMIIGMAVVGLTQIACALAPNLAVLITFRFLGGFFGSVGFNAIGTVSDLWGPDEQGWAVNTFAVVAETGAVLGPLIGGFVVQNIGWRWLFGVSGIVVAFLILVFALTVPETRAGVILTRRAKRLREQHKDSRYFATHEKLRSQHTISTVAKELVSRPLYMLFTESVVFWFGLFDGINYAVIYIFMEAYALVFVQYGFNTGMQGLTFIGIMVGFFIAFGLFALQQRWCKHAGSKRVDGQPTAEDRLLWGIPGGLLFPISLFFFAWTSLPSVPWILPVIAGATFGISSHILFLIVSDYTVAAYSNYSASAIAAQSLLREVLCGMFILFGDKMYRTLGYQWSSSLLGFIAIPLSIIPLVFYKFGPTIRKRSKFAEQLQKVEQRKKGCRQQLNSTNAAAGDLVAALPPTHPNLSTASASAQSQKDDRYS